MVWSKHIFSSKESADAADEKTSKDESEEAAKNDSDKKHSLTAMLSSLVGTSDETSNKEEEEGVEVQYDNNQENSGLTSMLPSFLSSASGKGGTNDGCERSESTNNEVPCATTSEEHSGLTSMLPSFLSSASAKGSNDDDCEKSESSNNEVPCATTSEESKYVFDPSGSYKFPNLFQEADDMVQASLLIYAFADLRGLARKGELVEGTNEEVFNLPMPAATCLHIIEQNEDVLIKCSDEKDVMICREALRAIHERCEISGEGLELISGDLLHNSTLVSFGDENSDKELVYAIAIDRTYRRVTVAFRGSVTQNDFYTDACISMTSVRNPVHELSDNQDEEIKLHSGFYEYMFPKGEEQSKFSEVMDQVVPLLEENPTYKLYVTGHSLGGALATLFAFQVVTSDKYQVQSPVTCISVASPKVGNESFRKAFGLLEEEGKLRHLRIANEKDPVTLGPPASSKLMLASLSPITLMTMATVSNTVENEIYKHVGVRLKLLEDEKKKFKLSFSTGSWRQDLINPKVSVFHHFGYEYSTRMLKAKADLEQLSLNDVYHGQGITKSK